MTYDDGMAVRREVLGDALVDRAIAGTTDFTADFQHLITRYAWGEIWTRPGLDRRSRSMITLTALIARGGPFEHRQDGSVFQNREHRLPTRPRGFYREYTVETPGSDDRGARRIVTGGDPPSEYWYSDDHYRSFRRIDAQGISR